MVSGLSSTKFERLHVAHPAQSSDMIETYRSSTSAPEVSRTAKWVPVMSSLVLGCLLLFSLYVVSVEQNQLVFTRHNLMELKLQLDLQREELLEVHANKGWNEELAAQQELKKLRRKSLETEEQLEEMIRRVAMVSKDKSDINSQITALTKEKQALARKLGMHLATQAIRTLKPNQ